MLKKTLLLTCITFVVLWFSTVATAIPPAINIPEGLRDGNLLTKHKQQIDDRIAWWKKSLLLAGNDEDIQRAGEKLLGDYLLYPNPSYQKTFAAETLKQYTDVLNGKVFESKPNDADSKDGSLATLKRINTALVFKKMNQPELQPAMQILVNDKNEALRFIGWLGYDAMRKDLLNGTENNLKTFVEDVKKGAKEETNPILLSILYRVMNLGTITEDVNEKLRLEADTAFLQALQVSWAARCKQVQAAKSAEEDLLPSLRLAVMALGSIGNDLKHAEAKDDKSITLCLQMIYDMTLATAKTYDRAWQDRANSAGLLDQCTSLLLACESALNTLADTKNTFLTEKTDMKKDQADRGAAVLEAALVDWGEALKDKGVKEPDAAK